jgi:hypothetical protein
MRRKEIAMSILKVSEMYYTPEELERSIENENKIAELNAEMPERLKQYKDLGLKTAAIETKMEKFKKRRALPQEIQEVEKEYQQAVWAQDAALATPNQQIKKLQNENEKLSHRLRISTHSRWLEEKKALLQLREIKIVKRHKDFITEKKSVDILTNIPAIRQADEMITAALRQLGNLHYASLRKIRNFIDNFESELGKVDLTKLSRSEKIPSYRVEEMMAEAQEASDDLDIATLMPDGEMWVHPPK